MWNSNGIEKRTNKIEINVIEPDGSILFGGPGKPYFQSGTGNPINAPIPKIIDYSLIDHNYYATDKEAFNTCRYLQKTWFINWWISWRSFIQSTRRYK